MNENEMLDNWANGNCKDVVEALIASGKLSEAIEFALHLGWADQKKLAKMLRNRDK